MEASRQASASGSASAAVAGASTVVNAAEKRYQPYFAPHQVSYLVSQNAGKLTPARVEALRQLACGLIDKIGSRLGFPRRTIATAQVLYHRFHLFFPLKDFAIQDVAVAALLVSSKLEDTLKKLREIQVAAYQIKAAQEGLGNALLEPDPSLLEADRARLIGIERLILETISFNFNLRSSAAYASREAASPASQNQDVFAYVVKFGHLLGASKEYVMRAFRMAVDAHRTLVPLSYPPHAIAAACLYLTSFLTAELSETGAPAFEAGWADRCLCDMEDIEDVCHSILDLLLAIGQTSKASPSDTLLTTVHSPREGQAPAPSNQNSASLAAELTQIKIRLRGDAEKRSLQADQEEEESEMNGAESTEGQRKRRKVGRRRVPSGFLQPALAMSGMQDRGTPGEDDREADVLGRDDVSVRFLWKEEGPAAAAA